MDWNEIWKIVLGIITSIGGIGIIIIAISKYLGKIFADKYLEIIKKDFEKEVEKYKTGLDIHKSVILRYSDVQFEQYSKLWASLYDLKISADKLWENASDRNLETFAKQLKSSKIQIEKAGLFIEDTDYENLLKILNHFLEYEVGKGKLIKYRRKNNVDEYQIENLISANRENKSNYDTLILKIKHNLRSQIKGDN